jgi:hypothetical protein
MQNEDTLSGVGLDIQDEQEECAVQFGPLKRSLPAGADISPTREAGLGHGDKISR